MTKLLIDGDVLAYRAGFATEKTKYLVRVPETAAAGEYENAADAKRATEVNPNGVIWSRKEAEPEDKALMLVDVMIRDILARYANEPSERAHLYLSGVGNFRHSVATRATYKGNRSGTLPPKHLKAIRDHLVSKWGAEVSAGEEADDLIGIAATANPGSIVCSIDKDLLQLPGRHYNFVTKEEVTIGAKEATLNFYSQVLSGDPTDSVLGLRGVGPATSRKLLKDCKSPRDCWSLCLNAYHAEFGEVQGHAYALETARLVYIRREVGQTWEPPNFAKVKAI